MTSPHLYRQNVALLRDGARVASRLTPAALRPLDGQSGVGAHFRHCVDCYGCFLRGIESTGDRLAVDYDARTRDGNVERVPAQVAGALEGLAARLEAATIGTDQVILVKVDTPAEPMDDAACWQGSTVGRELQFLISHTIHHYALIALLLRRQNIDPGDEFGVAPATLAHRRASSACAP